MIIRREIVVEQISFVRDCNVRYEAPMRVGISPCALDFEAAMRELPYTTQLAPYHTVVSADLRVSFGAIWSPSHTPNLQPCQGGKMDDEFDKKRPR